MFISVHPFYVVFLNFAKIGKETAIAPLSAFNQAGPQGIVAGIATNPSTLIPYA